MMYLLMELSLFNIRKQAAAPLAWLMVLAMLSPLSPHLAEGVALCIGEDHTSVEPAGASHHDGRAAALASNKTHNSAQSVSERPAFEQVQPAAPSLARHAAVSETSTAPSGDDECVDVPLRLVKTGDACYQAVQSSGSGEKVPPRLATQSTGIVSAGDPVPPAPSADARAPRSPRATAPSASPLASSTVVLLI